MTHDAMQVYKKLNRRRKERIECLVYSLCLAGCRLVKETRFKTLGVSRGGGAHRTRAVGLSSQKQSYAKPLYTAGKPKRLAVDIQSHTAADISRFLKRSKTSA